MPRGHTLRRQPITPERDEVQRLEGLWAGDFGDAYIERNRAAADGRAAFWNRLLTAYPVASALEVGCNLGGNLVHVTRHVPATEVTGVDINPTALATLGETLPGVVTVEAPARDLPFSDRSFDLVYTAGVLIHQPEETLREVMGQIVRCAARYVLCIEYHADDTVEVPYRGQDGALFKRDYGRLYTDWFDDLALLASGFLGRDEGFDDAHWRLFERGAP